MPLFDFLGPETAEQLFAELAAEGVLSSSMPAIAMAAFCKRERRLAKGLAAPNLFTLGFNEYDESNCSLLRFLHKLKKALIFLPEGSRFQLMVSNNRHWLAIDLHIVDCKLQSFILDGFITPFSENLNTILSELFPDGKHYLFTQSVSMRDGKNRLDKLQYSDSGCRLFALQHATQLSLMTADKLYSMLETCATVSDTGRREVSIQSLKENPRVAKSFAPLLMTVQSLSLFATLPKTIRSATVGKREQPLSDYISLRSGPSQGKIVSNVVPNKLVKVGGRVTERLLRTTEQQFVAIAYFSRGEFLLANPRLLIMLNQLSTQKLLLMRLSIAINFLDEADFIDGREVFEELIDRAASDLDLAKIYECLYYALTVTSKVYGFKRIVMAAALSLNIPAVIYSDLTSHERFYASTYINVLKSLNVSTKLAVALQLFDEHQANGLLNRMKHVFQFMLAFDSANTSAHCSSLRLLSLIGSSSKKEILLTQQLVCLERVFEGLEKLDVNLKSIWINFLNQSPLPIDLAEPFSTIAEHTDINVLVDELIAVINPLSKAQCFGLFASVDQVEHKAMLDFLFALKKTTADLNSFREVLAQRIAHYCDSLVDNAAFMASLDLLLPSATAGVAATAAV